MPGSPATLIARIPTVDLAHAALFLDFDGVLVDIAPRPDAITVPSHLPGLIAELEAVTDGATAIVTGRGLTDLRSYLPDVPRTVIGSHGAERAGGPPHPLAGSDDLRAAEAFVAFLAERDPGLLVEKKPLGVSLHYRAAPHLHGTLERDLARFAAEHPAFELHPAKGAFELRPPGIGKDHAIAALMAAAPFAGRTPIYLGDDTTDEPALAWVTQSDGIAIKVGAGETCAPHRVDAPSDVHALLSGWAEAVR
ncbi:MAG: trehalose-phosphatase [Pseudomonadota bacterium]